MEEHAKKPRERTRATNPSIAISLEARHAALKNLSRTESALLGLAVGSLKQTLTLPLLYWKNCAQQSLPLRLHPRYVYRGVSVACFKTGAMVSVQLLACSRIQAALSRRFADGGALAPRHELLSGFLGGAISGVAISSFELLLIQQQNFGGSLIGMLRKLWATHGGIGVFLRAAPLASAREACFTTSYVGVVPMVLELAKRVFFVAGVAISSFELLLIQQQNFGGSLIGTLRKLWATHGDIGVFLRAAPLASAREACFTASYVGVVPIVQRHLSTEYGIHQTKAALIGAIGSGLLATTISHPLDIVKTNMQGKLASPDWRTMSRAARTLYEARGAAHMLTAGLFWRASLNICSVFLFNELKIRLGPLMFPHVYES